MILKKGEKMNLNERLKRIKLISQQLYVDSVSISYDKKEQQLCAKSAILTASVFVDEFEKFENEINQIIEIAKVDKDALEKSQMKKLDLI